MALDIGVIAGAYKFLEDVINGEGASLRSYYRDAKTVTDCLEAYLGISCEYKELDFSNTEFSEADLKSGVDHAVDAVRLVRIAEERHIAQGSSVISCCQIYDKGAADSGDDALITLNTNLVGRVGDNDANNRKERRFCRVKEFMHAFLYRHLRSDDKNAYEEFRVDSTSGLIRLSTELAQRHFSLRRIQEMSGRVAIEGVAEILAALVLCDTNHLFETRDKLKRDMTEDAFKLVNLAPFSDSWRVPQRHIETLFHDPAVDALSVAVAGLN